LFFNFAFGYTASVRLWLGQKFSKKSHDKAALLRTLVGLIFARNKISRNYSINQGFDGFVFFEAINIAPIFRFFNFLLACT